MPPDSAANGEAEPARRGVGIPIRCPIGPLLPNIARVRVRISNHPHQRRVFCNERNRIIGTLAKRQGKRPESELDAAFTRTREFFGSRYREPSPKRKRGRARKDPPSFNARTHHQRQALTCARTCRSRTGAGDRPEAALQSGPFPSRSGTRYPSSGRG